METLTRTRFIIYANVVWFTQFLAEFLVVQAPDVVAWRERIAANFQVGCVGDTANYVALDRLYLLALAWVLTAPLMTVIALRYPPRWPEHMLTPLWNDAAPGASLVTMAAALALLLWPLGAAIATPVSSVILVETMRGSALFITALYYRGIVLA